MVFHGGMFDAGILVSFTGCMLGCTRMHAHVAAIVINYLNFICGHLTIPQATVYVASSLQYQS